MFGDFDKEQERFEKQFDRTQKTILAGAVVSGIATIGTLVFVGWIIVKLLQHFGVI